MKNTIITQVQEEFLDSISCEDLLKYISDRENRENAHPFTHEAHSRKTRQRVKEVLSSFSLSLSPQEEKRCWGRY